MLALANSWALRSTATFTDTTRKALPLALPYQFKARVIRVESSCSGVAAHWRLAGYLNQVISVIPKDETFNEVVPLNTRKIYPMPLLAPQYRLMFIPVRWLPAGLKLRVWEYTGPQLTTEELTELLLLK